MATKKPAIEDTAVTPAENSNDVKVTVRSTPLVVKTAEPEPVKAGLTVHHELTITPPSASAPEPVTLAEPTVEETPAEPAPVEPPKPVEASDEVAQSSTKAEAFGAEAPKPPTDDAPKTDPKPPTDGAAKAEEMQSPKVFDTKQYHLPIDEGAVHGKGKFLMIFLVFLLLVLVAGAIAIDAGWIKPGFNLPFDLIK